MKIGLNSDLQRKLEAKRKRREKRKAILNSREGYTKKEEIKAADPYAWGEKMGMKVEKCPRCNDKMAVEKYHAPPLKAVPQKDGTQRILIDADEIMKYGAPYVEVLFHCVKCNEHKHKVQRYEVRNHPLMPGRLQFRALDESAAGKKVYIP